LRRSGSSARRQVSDDMNILMIGDTLPQDKPGGGGTYLLELSRRLASSGHRVFVMVQMHNPACPVYETEDGVHIYRFDYNRRTALTSLISRFLNARKLFEKLAQEVKFDVINVHFSLGAFGVFGSRLSRSVPCIFTFHGPWSHEALIENTRRIKDEKSLAGLSGLLKEKLAFWVMSYIERRVVQKTNKFLVISRFSKDLLARIYKVSEEKIAVIPSGVDLARFHLNGDKNAAKSKIGIPPHLPVLLSVRRLVSRMGLEHLIEAMPLLLKQQKALLVIGGTGYLEHELRYLVGKLGLEDHVRFVGYVSDEELPLYYQAADLFIIPSVAYEGFGLVTLEALSSGVPVLGSRVGGTVEILEKLDSGLLISDNRPESLAEAISVTLARKDLTPNRLRQFVEKNYCWESIFPRVEKCFVDTADRSNEKHFVS